MSNKATIRKCFAELLGTFALVLCGTGAIVINQQTNGEVSHVGIAITFGLIVMAMIYALGNISGEHLNPAVTIAFTLAKKVQITIGTSIHNCSVSCHAVDDRGNINRPINYGQTSKTDSMNNSVDLE